MNEEDQNPIIDNSNRTINLCQSVRSVSFKNISSLKINSMSSVSVKIFQNIVLKFLNWYLGLTVFDESQHVIYVTYLVEDLLCSREVIFVICHIWSHVVIICDMQRATCTYMIGTLTVSAVSYELFLSRHFGFHPSHTT